MAKLAKEVGIIVEEPEIEVIIEGPDGDDDYETDDEMAEDTSVELAVPEGGIGGFAMSEADFAILEAEEAKKEFGEEGLAQFTAVAKKMAGHGRFGDDSVAHLQTGEMVVPLTLLESNPALKAQIFKSLRENGIEDPEQYVVGSNANSINPETGLMEFGFFSKLWKGIKKVVKAVVKVVKKIAPIVLPIALAFTPLGLIYGAALGSGIGTLINGGSIKDALKSALISGATGAVFQGFTGAGTFGENVKAGLVDPFGRISQTASGAVTSAGNVFGSEATKLANATGGVGGAAKQTFFSQYVPTAAVGAAGAAGPGAAGPVVPDAGAAGPVVPDAGAAPVVKTGDAVLGTNQAGATTGTSLSKSITLDKPPGFYESLKGALTPGDKIGFVEGMGNAFFPKSTSVTDVLGAEGITPVNATAAQLTGAEVTAKALSPGLFRSYAPLAALATTGAMAGGFFDVPEMEMPGLVQRQEDGTVTTGADLIAADPSKYLVADLGATRLNPETGEYEDVLDDELTIEAPDTSMYTVPTNYPLQQQVAMSENGYLMRSNPGGPFARPYVQGAAQGGPIFPRRNGGVAPTEGVQGQDSVRAMLMPGEFVMTTDAVRGLGNGNLNNGIKNMYSVMRNLERRGRATA
jgi:hypothetical protein